MTVVLLIALGWLLLGALVIVWLNVAKALVRSSSPAGRAATGTSIARPSSGSPASAGTPSVLESPAPGALPPPLAAARSRTS